jgi:hypothetical protein
MATLAARLQSFAQEIALDVRALFQRAVPPGGSAGQVLAKTSATNYATAWQTPSGGVGGGLQNVAVSVVPAKFREAVVAATALGVTPTNRIICSLAANADWDADELLDFDISAEAGTDQIIFNIQRPGPIGGAFLINYQIG